MTNPPGDPGALDELYQRHFPQVYRFVYSRVRDQTVTEEVTAAVFEQARHGIGRRQDIGKPVATWLYHLAVNELADRYRKDRPADETG